MFALEDFQDRDGGVNRCGTHELSLAALFGDGAVLQRDMPLPVWGKAAPRCRIICTLGERSASAIADCNGRFKLILPPQPAGCGLQLILKEVESGRELVRKNIALGEVYLAAGQSNMEFALKRSRGGEAAVAGANDPELRYFQVKVTSFAGEQSDVSGRWRAADPESAGDFSAVAYHFAAVLRRELNVPVGIIGAALGGVPAETFISREMLLRMPEFRDELLQYDLELFDCRHYHDLSDGQTLPQVSIGERLMKMFPEKVAQTGLQAGWNKIDFDDSAWETMELPDSWTLTGANHAGVFWFRKELQIPESWAGRELSLGIGGADKQDETYFNGEFIGSTGDYRKFAHWNTPRYYKIPGELVKAGRAVIAVRVASAASICCDGGLIGPAEDMRIECGNQAIPLAGKWLFKCEHNFGTAGMTFMRTIGPGFAGSLHMLFDNIILPLIPYALRGVLWYQGEANAICQADGYRTVLSSLIMDWRQRWGQPKLDFLIIQLPGFQAFRKYSEHSQWAKLREAQRLAAMDHQCRLITSLEFGDVNEIHPLDKEPLGIRAGLTAADQIKGSEAYLAPQITGCRREGAKLMISFDMPLKRSGQTEHLPLVLAGRSGEFFPAEATFADGGRSLELAAAEVAEPQRVRYAWSNNPPGADLKGDGRGDLPVSPFELSVVQDQ